MAPHDSRDLDSVIDDVARALTSGEPARDLRASIVSRVSPGSSSTVGWRAGLAAVGIAAVVFAALVLRPGVAPSAARVASRAPEAVVPLALPAPVPQASPATVARDASLTPPITRRARAVRRQIVDEAADPQTIVEIEPLAILPLREDRAPALTQVRIAIAPIDVEPVRIRELGEASE